MKKRLIPLILMLLVALTACSGNTAPTAPLASQPTLPDFDRQLTPREQIDAAIEKTKAAGSFRLTFGQIRQEGEGTTQILATQQVCIDDGGQYTSLLVDAAGQQIFHEGLTCYRLDTTQDPPVCDRQTADRPFTSEEIFAAVYETFPDRSLLDRFCGMRLIATPSNDGSFRYQLTELTIEELYSLIHGQAPEPDSLSGCADATGSASIDVDPEGHLTQIRFDAYLTPTVTHTLLLTVEDIGQTQIQTPAWVSDAA